MATVDDFLAVLEAFLPVNLSLQRALYIVAVLGTIFPFLRLHRNQAQHPRQPAVTSWLSAARAIIGEAFSPVDTHGRPWEGEVPEEEYVRGFQTYLETLADRLGLSGITRDPQHLFPKPPIILITTQINCTICPPSHALRIKRERTRVQVITADCKLQNGILQVAHCPNCKSDFYPDRITFKNPAQPRQERPICDAVYLRISKTGLWVDRRVAIMQERATFRMRSGWSNFALWFNDVYGENLLTYRQSRRLFMEHFCRRLLVRHGLQETFHAPAHPNTQHLVEAALGYFGQDGGVIPGGQDHECADCTHQKRYLSDLQAEGLVQGDQPGPHVMVEGDAAGAGVQIPIPDPEEPGENVPRPQASQPAPPEGDPLYVRAAVMDGKNMGHKICAEPDCRNPLANYKNGRFCLEHLHLVGVCGIVGCNEPVNGGQPVCQRVEHKTWYQHYLNRFGRLSHGGVTRILRRDPPLPGNPSQPSMQVNLPPLGDITGDQVKHTFRARTVYCLQTIQFSCGMPVGWGKCYNSESPSQVFSIVKTVFPPNVQQPDFLFYDNACNLYRHLLTQHPNDTILNITRFVVDSWHYINHQAQDTLCRLWCNPAPADGSQPDLIQVQNVNGRVLKTRAFNTETAEQFNAWLSGFEVQLRHMTNTNYDFFIHVLFLLYAEMVEARIEAQQAYVV